MNIKDRVYKIITPILLLFYDLILLGYLFEGYYIDNTVYGFLEIYLYLVVIAIGLFSITYLVFTFYLNKHKSDKWILLPLGFYSLSLVFITVFYLDVSNKLIYFVRNANEIIIFNIFLFVISIFAILNVILKYKFNILTSIIIGVGIIISFLLVSNYGRYLEVVIFGFNIVSLVIYILYLWLANKGDTVVINRNFVYQKLVNAKSLFDQGIINADDFEAIRQKYVKYL